MFVLFTILQLEMIKVKVFPIEKMWGLGTPKLNNLENKKS